MYQNTVQQSQALDGLSLLLLWYALLVPYLNLTALSRTELVNPKEDLKAAERLVSNIRYHLVFEHENAACKGPSRQTGLRCCPFKHSSISLFDVWVAKL
ncbi:hypothetical protein QCA50_004152 [Cerrena zonata]|uniref:Uncharacterized protein n=1 Tax=Cerrena zonata TaxID=2478898 RepID=A0AAW0GKP4_9APHY